MSNKALASRTGTVVDSRNDNLAMAPFTPLALAKYVQSYRKQSISL
jgi:GTP-dependent phosphoenolpyruvate carboxykinase